MITHHESMCNPPTQSLGVPRHCSGIAARWGLSAFVVLIVLMLASLSEPALAARVDATKIVTWIFQKQPAAEDAGIFSWNFADSIAKDDHINKPAPAPTFGDGTWRLRDGLTPATQRTTEQLGGVPAGEPSARADAFFSAAAVGPLADLFVVNGQMNTVVQVFSVPINPGGHKNQVVKAVVKAKMQIKSGTVSGVILTQPGAKVTILDATKYEKGEGTVPLGLESQKGKWSDPISIELKEIETGRVITEQLFNIIMDGEANGEWSWDDIEGIVLDVPNDGLSFASITGGFNSSWITSSPGLFSVSLADGVFSTSGSLDGLPWDLTYEGSDVVRAHLSLGSIPALEAEYQVPSSLVVGTNNYQPTLIIGSDAEVDNTCCPGEAIPVASEWSLIVLTSLLLAGIAVKFGRRRDKAHPQ